MNCVGPSLNLGVALATLAPPRPHLFLHLCPLHMIVTSFKIQTRLCTQHMQWTDCQHHNGLLIQHIMVRKDSQSHSHTPSLPEHSPVNCRKREQKKKLDTIVQRSKKVITYWRSQTSHHHTKVAWAWNAGSEEQDTVYMIAILTCHDSLVLRWVHPL